MSKISTVVKRRPFPFFLSSPSRRSKQKVQDLSFPEIQSFLQSRTTGNKTQLPFFVSGNAGVTTTMSCSDQAVTGSSNKYLQDKQSNLAKPSTGKNLNPIVPS